jgi:hypothetical protein
MLNRNQPSNIRLGRNCSKVKNTPAYLSQEFNNAGHFWTCRSSFVDNLVFFLIVKTFTIVFLCGATTLSITTFSIMTLSLTTLSMTTLHNNTQHDDSQHNDIQHDDSRHNDTQHNILQIATLGITNNNTQ